MLTFYLLLLDEEEDKRKFHWIYDHLRHPMYRAALGLLRSEDQAQDAVQTAFLKIIKNFSKISSFSRNEMAPYVVTIAENAAKDMLKLAERRHTRPLDEEDWEPSSPESVESVSGYERLVLLILEMPKNYREVLYLACVEEESNQNIARRLGLSEAQVKTRLSRGRKLLQERVLEEGYTT